MNKVDNHRAKERREQKSTVEHSLDVLIPQEHEEAARYLRQSEIRMGTFQDLYGPETVARDVAEVERLKKIFAEQGKYQYSGDHNLEEVRKLSEISESYLLRGINESNWIPHCTAVKTSDFDDYINGTDMILEYQPREENPANHIGLGIDITFASSVQKKLARIKGEIHAGELPSIKYFDSPKSHVRGQLRQVPRGVVGFDQETLMRLSQQRLRYGKLSKDDPERVIMLHQLAMQFRTFTEYAQEIDSPAALNLARSSKFVELLSTYVLQYVPNHAEIFQNSTSVRKLARSLETFRDL